MSNDATGADQQRNPDDEQAYRPPQWPQAGPPPGLGDDRRGFIPPAGEPMNPPPAYGPGGPHGSPPPYPASSLPPGPQPYLSDATWLGHGPGQPGMGAPGWVPVSTRRRARRWWLLGGLGVVVVAAVVVVGVVVVGSGGGSADRQATATTRAATTPSAPPVPMSALDGLLLSPADVAAVVKSPPLVSVMKPEESHAFYGDLVVDNDCVGVAFAATQSFYEGSGWVSMRKQPLADTPDTTAMKYVVTEAVVAFPNAGAAMKFYHRALDVFHKCANRNINLHELNQADSGKVFMTVGQISEKDGIVSTSLLREGGDGWNCQRGVSVRNNIAIDTAACGYSMPDSVTPALVKPIASKIDTAR